MQALIPLALEGTDVGKVKAAHALAKIAAVSNPDIAFPGERVGDGGSRVAVMGGVCSQGPFPLPPYPWPGRGRGAVTKRAMNWRCVDPRPGSTSDE